VVALNRAAVQLALCCALVGLAWARAGEAEESRRPEVTGWLAAGAGPASIRYQDGGGGRLEAAVGLGHHLLSLRYLHVADTNGDCSSVICLGNDVSLPRNSGDEIAVQYGAKLRAPYLLTLASAGLGAVRTVTRGNNLLSQDCFFGCLNTYDHTTRWTGALTAEVGGYLSARAISFGPTFVVDVNPVQPFWGLLIDLHLGWMGEAPQ
jgi:hypothetical protein